MFSGMDYDFWLRILTVTRDLVRDPELLGFFRWHEQSQISAVKLRPVVDAHHVRQDVAHGHPDLVAQRTPGNLRKLSDGPLLYAGYARCWKHDLTSAQRLLRKGGA